MTFLIIVSDTLVPFRFILCQKITTYLKSQIVKILLWLPSNIIDHLGSYNRQSISCKLESIEDIMKPLYTTLIFATFNLAKNNTAFSHLHT